MNFANHEDKLLKKMSDLESNPTKRVQRKVSKHSGFIPCSYCSWKVLSNQCTIEDLITNRTAEEPFRTKKIDKM
jgi:hypothetical protein